MGQRFAGPCLRLLISDTTLLSFQSDWQMLNELNSDHTAATEELEALQDWGACVIRVALARAFSARNASRAAVTFGVQDYMAKLKDKN